MTTIPPSRLSQDGDRPPGAYAGAVGSDRAQAAAKAAVSIAPHASPPPPSAKRWEDERLVVYLLRIAALTIACMILAGLVAAVVLLAAAADHPTPWEAVQLALATALVDAAPFVAAFLSAVGGLAAIILVVFLLVVAVAERFPQSGFRPRPEPTTGGGERE